jgi:ATP-dependent Lon protease
MVVTIALESAEAKAAAASAGEGGHLLLVPKTDDRYAAVGVIASIESTVTLRNGQRAVVVRALHRARVGVGVIGTGDGLWLEASPIDDPEPTSHHRELAGELRATLRALFDSIGNPRLIDLLAGVDEPGALADSAGWWPDLSIERKVELLEAVDLTDRLELVTDWAKEALAERELAEKISSDVRDGMEKTQRDFLLRQQLDAIRKELGDDDSEGDAASYRERLAGLELPEATHKAIERELDRLERTNPQAVEHGWIRTWLETIFDLPWNVVTDDQLDLHHARGILDADHTGLDDVKDRIVEELAVRKLRRERAGELEAEAPRATILALVGPPGVGKTSLGRSIARALGREFVRVALGGVRDEAEIRGHRRTYVGAQPGRIVRALTEAGTMNPVFLLDELDKVGNDWRGDPAAALLEVLDPAQNHSFRDHYLEVDLDLSDVLFIATANVLETIPAPLLDRLEIVQLDGYTEDEKVAIARDHLLARVNGRSGLKPGEVEVTDAALHRIVDGYTREAGVRGLERQLGKVIRKAATTIASDVEGDDDGARSLTVTIDAGEVTSYLGRPRFHAEEIAERTATPGVATGLAVTGAGGDVLFVEATALPGGDQPGGEPGLTVTGQLGDVMRESARIALSYVRSHRDAIGLAEGADRKPVHIHFPAGAVPKDGPSAGITMTTALASLLSGRPVRPEVGMTGEVTLQGRVLPIGGLKQKVLAAHRAGLTEVILPARNEGDLEDLPSEVRDAMTFHPVHDVADVLRLALAAQVDADPTLSTAA